MSTLEDYQNPISGGNTGTYLWKCITCGTERKLKYNGLASCGVCYKNVAKTEENYHILAESLNLKWIGDELPKYNTIITQWQCKDYENHIWPTSYRIVRDSDGCPICTGTVRVNEKDYHCLADSKNITWIGPELPSRISDHTFWKCNYNNDHIFNYTYNSLRYRINGCSNKECLTRAKLLDNPEACESCSG